MTTFRVTKIIDGDTFDVAPGWVFNGKTGSRVRPAGYDTPEMGSSTGEAAKRKLSNLIYGENVELDIARRIDRGRLVCDVLLNGKNIADRF